MNIHETAVAANCSICLL